MQNIIVLLLVAAACVYTVVWLKRFASGESKCVCGTKSCGSAARACDSGGCSKTETGDRTSLPLINLPGGSGGCGKR